MPRDSTAAKMPRTPTPPRLPARPRPAEAEVHAAAASSASAHVHQHKIQPLQPIGAKRSRSDVSYVEPEPAAPRSPAQGDPADKGCVDVDVGESSPDSDPVKVSPGTAAAAAATTTEIALKKYHELLQAVADAKDQKRKAEVAVEYTQEMYDLAVFQKRLKESEFDTAQQELERAIEAASVAAQAHAEAAKQDSEVDGRRYVVEH